MTKHKTSNNVFRSKKSTQNPLLQNLQTRGGKQPRSEIVANMIPNSNDTDQRQYKTYQKRKDRNNDKQQRRTKTTGTKGKKQKLQKLNTCNTDINNTSLFDMWSPNPLLRSNSLSSITPEVTDSQATRDQQEIERLQKIIDGMRKKKEKKKKQKKYIVSQQFEWNVKQIVKEHLYPKVKFITSAKQMESITDKKSIGYWFLKHYRNMELQDKIYADEEFSDSDIWRHSKNIVYNTIKQKRGTVQTEIKKGWIGECAVVCENLKETIFHYKSFSFHKNCIINPKQTHR